MTHVQQVRSPIDGEVCFEQQKTYTATATGMGTLAERTFRDWRLVPAPVRGELVRRFGEKLRAHEDVLAAVITRESGKLLSEAHIEVRKMADMCDFAAGLSRQLHGITMPSERARHRLMEQWHPLGPVLVITSFNFPAAVFVWNAALALVCGNPVIWKPSEKCLGTADLCTRLFREAATEVPGCIGHRLLQVAVGGADVAKALVALPYVRLVSATGSCAMGRDIAARCAPDLGKRMLLELGGNNASIVTPSADLASAVPAIVAAATGMAGQRCTSLRRLIVHESVRDALVERLEAAYAALVVGDPRIAGTHVGPMIDAAASLRMTIALQRAAKEDGTVVYGGKRVAVPGCDGGYYRHPALITMPSQTEIVREETFAPILYVMTYRYFDDAIAMQNGVAQGLASSIFTNDVREAEAFLSAAGSDCGVAAVNTGPALGDIGGAFGGEKDTGGGRECGSDAWRQYMRRSTQVVNFG